MEAEGRESFTTSTQNLLEREKAAGVSDAPVRLTLYAALFFRSLRFACSNGTSWSASPSYQHKKTTTGTR